MKAFKKISIVAGALVLCVGASVGCGKNSIKSPDQTTAPTNVSVSTEAVTTAASSAAAETTAKSDSQNTTEESLKELGFIYKENTIALLDTTDDQKIEGMLGKAENIKTHTYSSSDGLNMDQLTGKTEKQYFFPGLVIKTIDAAEDNKFYIYQIEITSPQYTSVRNIKVGDSFETLKEAYPEGNLLGGEISDGEDDFRFEEKDYTNVMNFHIKNRKVVSIQIYSLID
ncbi:hypothetical protein RZO55_24605 [Clostridium boliviensis]|uniref:Lipoprotein n=1 Tax=Clostridium boliviensis TaxID=318465 RepID=A0ABU4GSZ2_9CLOT|nr:hypothetical protein [Clostridium boliviensis]MDW2800756.1 hypothetical protein [Clostridium boliviensis]